MARFFPFLIIILQSAACGAYLFNGDWRRGCYWGAAAVLTICITF